MHEPLTSGTKKPWSCCCFRVLANAQGKVSVTSHTCNSRSILQCFELVASCVLFACLCFFIIVVLGIYVHGEAKVKLTERHVFAELLMHADASVSCVAYSKES